MNWNYRTVKTKEGYSIYEVYYDENGKPIGTTKEPILDFYCKTPEDLMYELEVIKKAFESPPINDEDIGKNNENT